MAPNLRRYDQRDLAAKTLTVHSAISVPGRPHKVHSELVSTVSSVQDSVMRQIPSPFAVLSRHARIARIGDGKSESLPYCRGEAMETITLTITLPRELATEANQAGLLTSESLVALLKREVRQRRTDNLFAAIDRLDHKNTNILDVDEISAEIAAARAERCRPANLGTVGARS